MNSMEITLLRLVQVLVAIIFLVGPSDESLVSWGSNVCSKEYSYTTYINYQTSYTSYRETTSKCGWKGWSRCRRSRSYRTYYYATRAVSRLRTYYVCCSGWSQRGSSCPDPICSGGCVHGSCYRPDSCSCSSGWKGSRCQYDINECQSSNGGCQHSCFNSGGSYSCGCYRGYRKSSSTACQDYNECNNSPCACASDTDACGATCTNTRGSYTCSCGEGFQLVSGNVCKDIDECLNQDHSCAHTCINTIGSYSCICRPGYLSSQNGRKCTDIDECQVANGECEHDCRNTPGSRVCSCRNGYRLDANERTCKDIDECSETSPCHHQCTNLAGSFSCSCRPGYRLNYDKTTCTDINECKSSSDCEQTCTNTEGSYTCGCRLGYKLRTGQKSCKDVDECTMGTHQCSQLCINTIGSYQCRCMQGYELDKDGRICKGIPCATLHGPIHGLMSCTGMATNDNCSFTCNHGYNMEGSSAMTCMTTSRWSDSQPTCKAKECGALTPSSQVILSLPCYRTYKSSCDMRCSSGFYSTGDSKVNCDLTGDKGSVAWKNDFQCHHTELCKPNPCQHGGKCVVMSSKTFKCDCSNTGYIGHVCQEGVVELPMFPKLKDNLESPPLIVHAKPSKEIHITIQSDEHVVSHPRTIKILNVKTDSPFTVTSKQPGLEAVSFSIEGENGKDFKSPPDRVLFTGPQTLNKKNIFADIPILPGELPTGCHVIKTNTFSCNVKLSSTLPWKRSHVNKQSSTQGIVHLVNENGKTIPWSLIGAVFPFSNKNIIKNVKRIHQLSKDVRLKTSRNNTCISAALEVSQLMELVENDDFESSFIDVISKSMPSWLRLYKKTKSEHFDLGNIHAKVGLQSTSCSSLLKSSNVITYEPSIGLTISLGEDVMLPDEKGFCYAIDICTSDVSFSLPQSSVKAFVSSSFFQDMKTRGWEIEPVEIMFSGSTSQRLSLELQLWDGKNMIHERTQEYKFAIAGKMKTKLENRQGVTISLDFEGNAYVNTANVSELFYDGFQSKITSIFKGKASMNMTTTVFNEKVTITFPHDEVIGKSTLGGDSVDQKLFFNWKQTRDPFQGTPFASIVRPAKNQPFFVAVEHQIRGGKQKGIANINDFNMKITLVNLLLSQMRNILNNPQVKLVVKQNSIKRWTSHINEAETMIIDLRAVSQTPISDSKLNTFSFLISKFKIHVRIVEHLCKVIEFALNEHAPSPEVTMIIAQVKQLKSNLPQLPDVQIERSKISQDLKGFKMRFQGAICEKRMCFNDMQVVLDTSHTNRVSSKPQSHDRSMIVRGETLKELQLGEFLTLAKQREVNIFIPAAEKSSTLVFEPTVNIMGIMKPVRVKMLNDRLSFQTSGLLFGKYDALITGSANLDVSAWSLLKYNVTGKMKSDRSLPNRFERKMNNYVRELATKAITRVQNGKTAARKATDKLLPFKTTIKYLFENHQMYDRQKRKLSTSQKLAKRNYFLLKNQVRKDVLLPIQTNGTQTCQPKQCPKVCSRTKLCTFENEKLEIKETQYNCKEVQTYVQVTKIVKRTAIAYQYKKTFYVVYTGNCVDDPFQSSMSQIAGAVGAVVAGNPILGYLVGRVVGAFVDSIGKSMFGCDHTYRTVQGPDKKISFLKVWNEEVPYPVPVTEYKCTSYVVKRKTNSFQTPKFTCKEGGCSIKVMEPNCIKSNNQCIKQYRHLQANRSMSEYEKYKVETLLKLNRLGNNLEIANTKLEKIKAKRAKAIEELKMAKAQLRHLEYAKNKSENAIKEVEGFESTKLGMKLSRLVAKTPQGQNVVSVSDLTFNVTTTEANKREITLHFTVMSAHGQTKDLSFLFDFGKDDISLHKMVKNTVKSLYQEHQNGRRRRRSISDEWYDKIKKTNDTESLKELDNHDRCMLAKKGNLFYRDIVKSLQNLIRDREDVEKSNMADVKKLHSLYLDFENIARDISQDGDVNDTDNSGELIKSYANMISSLMDDKQNSSLMSWNQSLISWRAFLEVLTNERSFTDCVSVQDCLIAVGDDLDELYFYESDFQRGNEIREMLSNVTSDILELITTNVTVEEFTSKLSLLDELLNQTVDTNVLCGKKPEITFNSGESRVVLENDTFVLECTAESDTSLLYEWIHKNVSILQSTNGSLTIRNANISHAGGYQCKASNRKGAVTSNMTVITINSKPRITQHPNDTIVYIEDGVGLLLRCNVTGVPFPRVNWFFVSQHPNSSIIPLNNDNGTFLYYKFMDPDDSGYYFCTATNKHGQVKSKNAKVWVLDTSPGEPRLGIKVNMERRCKKQRGCVVHRPNMDNSKQLNQYSQLLSTSMKSSQSQITNMKYTSDDQWNAAISFIYRSSRPEKQDVHEAVFDPILESFSRKRVNLVKGVKTLYQQMKNGSFAVSSDDEEEELTGDADSLMVWVEPPGCPRGQQPHSNGYMCALCPPGTYGKEDGRCEPCPVKTYQHQAGQTKCYSCRDGYITNQSGSLSPVDCYDMRTSPPRDLQAIAIGSTRLQVKWQKPEENSDSVIYYFIKLYGLVSRNLKTKAVPKTTTSWSLKGLTKFTDYRIVVYAVNSYGSKKSEIVTKTGEDIPDATPFITGAIPISHNSVRVSWRPIPKHQRNGIIQGYHIYYSEYSRDQWKVYTTSTGNITTCVVPGLKPFTWYCVKMSAFTSKGQYPHWKRTPCNRLKTPSRSVKVTGRAANTTEVILKFQRTTIEFRSQLVNYGENPARLTHVRECSSSSCIIGGLKEDTLYYFKVTGQIIQIGEAAVIIQIRTLKKKGP